MMDDDLNTMFLCLEGGLNNIQQQNFEQEIRNNTDFRKSWYDLLSERYLDEDLNSKWMQHVETLKKVNAEFQESLELQVQMRNQLVLVEDERLRSEIKEMIPPIAKSTSRSYQYVLIAGILAIILMFLFYYLSRPKQDVQHLYAQYYQPYEMLLSARGETTEQTDLQQAIIAYQSQDFQLALIHFNAIHEGDIQLIKLYRGICALETAQIETAIRIFISLQGDDRIGPQADWYLALAYLKKGDKEKAVKMLDEIASSDHYFSQKATALTRELDKL